MAKTKPIGVRFDEEIMAEIKAPSAQGTLIFLENFYKASQRITKNFLTSDKPVFKPENIGILIPKNGNVSIRHYPLEKKDMVETKFSQQGITPIDEVYKNNSEIQKQIDAVKNEVKPSWIAKSQFERYQEKKINELKKQIHGTV